MYLTFKMPEYTAKCSFIHLSKIHCILDLYKNFSHIWGIKNLEMDLLVYLKNYLVSEWKYVGTKLKIYQKYFLQVWNLWNI